MSEEEMDNFRSMRGKSGYTSHDLLEHMTSDAEDLTDRLHDVKHRREIEKRVFDTTGQAYTILITPKDVRLVHVDEKGHYHFNHFNTEKRPASKDKKAKPTEQSWRIIDDEEADHVFADVSPSRVTVYHQGGTWQVRRSRDLVREVEDSERNPPLPGNLLRSGRMKHGRPARTWRLYSDVDSNTGRSSNASPQAEPLLCANTPGEKGVHSRAHQSFYHDL